MKEKRKHSAENNNLDLLNQLKNLKLNGFLDYNDYFTPVVFYLICVNVLIYALGSMLPGGVMEGEVISLKTRLEVYFALWQLRSPFFGFWQYLTYMFLHGGLSHLLLNMFGLWMFGSQVERVWGAKKTFSYYILCGIGAGVIHTLVYLIFDDGLLGGEAVGASGAIMGIIIAFGFMYPEVKIYFMFFLPIKAKYAILIFAAIDLYLGILGNDNVAHFAHLGGALMGFILIKTNLYGKYQLKYFQENQTRLEYQNVPKSLNENSEQTNRTTTVVYDYKPLPKDEMLNLLLDKISASGYNSLTDEEKKYLDDFAHNL